MHKETEAKIEKTIFEVRTDEKGNVLSYRIFPKEGYKLHEITLDEEVVDKETLEPMGEKKLGFTTSYVTAGADYDFEKNEREIYAVKEEKKDDGLEH